VSQTAPFEMPFVIRPVRETDLPEWLRLRRLLWPATCGAPPGWCSWPSGPAADWAASSRRPSAR
jgi:hypothetical protein